MTQKFDAARHLIQLKGKDYLEVKWRLLWLRTEQPDASLETEMVKADDTFAIFKAKVSLPNGGSATGWGSETSGDFGDYIEKAETKAIGRALAALGFGTQFADLEEGARIVDSPVARPPRAASSARTSPLVQAALDAGATLDHKDTEWKPQCPTHGATLHFFENKDSGKPTWAHKIASGPGEGTWCRWDDKTLRDRIEQALVDSRGEEIGWTPQEEELDPANLAFGGEE